MGNDSITWEGIYSDIDTILNGGEPEHQGENKREESRRKGRVVRLQWDSDESDDEDELNMAPGEIPGQLILKASGKDRRRLFR
jgi:hypothetical protein